MTPGTARLRQTFVAGLLLFVGATLALTAYTVWRLRADAVVNGLEISAMHSRGFEDHLTQSLYVTELVAANLLGEDIRTLAPDGIGRRLFTTLQRAPFLRSLSLIDGHGQIVASSNPANVGVTLETKDYLPLASEKRSILRIGQPWSGRDFVNGTPSSTQKPLDSEVINFIPVTQTLEIEGRSLTLLVALNPDYFINHISQKIGTDEGSVEILRYDGTLLMSTDASKRPGSLQDYVARDLRLGEVESGQFEQNTDGKLSTLTAFRASRLYPVLVVTHLKSDFALRTWSAEVNTLLGFVLPALLAVSALAVVFYRRQSQLAGQRAEFERLQSINATVFDSSEEAILITDLDTRIISINLAFTRVTGHTAGEIIGRHLFDLLAPEGIATFSEKLMTHATTGHAGIQVDFPSIEVQLRCTDGRLLWMEILSTPERNAQGEIAGHHRICRNITERKQAEEKLLLSANVFTHALEGIMITDANGTIVDVNAAFSQITGYSREEALGNTPRLLRSDQHDESFYSTMWRELAENDQWHGEIWNQRKNGELLAEILTISAVKDTRGINRQYVALFTDITPLKKHEKELESMAHFDPLTLLPNRILLADRLQQAMTQAERRGKLLAVAFLDLDGFKAINDNHGHKTGDQLLVAVATRMKHTLREGDTLARLGGDEFIAILLDLSDVETSIPTLTRLLDAAARPVQAGDHLVRVSASLGVTFYPQADELNADQLLRQADQAMYQAKLAGKNRYHIFEAQQERDISANQSAEV